jgi:hypothetical protein
MMLTYLVGVDGQYYGEMDICDLTSLGSPSVGKKDLHYMIHEFPFPGCSKEISIRSDLTKSSMGSIQVKYEFAGSDRKYRTSSDSLAYLKYNNKPTSLNGLIDFRMVFCVCHQPQDDRMYVQCWCRLGGCNGYILTIYFSL